MPTLRQDFLYALRLARRQPLLFTIASMVLAVAIAASTAIFSLVSAVLLRPLPFRAPEQLVVISEHSPAKGVPFIEVSYPNYLDWRTQSSTLETAAAMGSGDFGFIIAGEEPVEVPGRLVTGNFFDVLGTSALLGRTLGPADDQTGAPRVAVMSHRLWTRQFGEDPSVVGRNLVIAGAPMTVVGVMPRDFQYPPETELWLPVVPAAPTMVAERGTGWGFVLGRLREGQTAQAAQVELDGIVRRLWATYSAAEADRRALVRPLSEHLFGPTSTALFVLLCAGLLVLLIACANVCALFLARAGGRQREIAVRLALGASRARVLRQLLTESALIAGVGGLVGLLLAIGGLNALVALVPGDVPRLENASVDVRVIAFAFVLTVLSTVASGLVPALVASKPSLTVAVGHSARLVGEASRNRTSGLLIAGEAAAALTLLCGAGLLTRTFQNLQNVSLGFDPQKLLTIRISGNAERYPKYQDLYQTILERIDTLPGVHASGAVSIRPLRGQGGWDWVFALEGQSDEQSNSNPFVNMEDVTPRYFETMRIPLLAGRSFTERDDERAPGVVIVSDKMAKLCWPGQVPVGKRLKVPLPGTTYHLAWLTVVGVVGDARYRELEGTRLDLYMPYRQSNHGLSNILVRSVGDPLASAPAIRAVVRSIDPSLVVSELDTMDAVVGTVLGSARFGMQLASAFALAALVLSALGTYGLTAFLVGCRTRELGIRMALGARGTEIKLLLLRQSMVPIFAGLIVGLVGALVLGRALQGLLFGIPPHAPGLLATASFVLIATALAACWLPARRAAQTDPARALREQ